MFVTITSPSNLPPPSLLPPSQDADIASLKALIGSSKRERVTSLGTERAAARQLHLARAEAARRTDEAAVALARMFAAVQAQRSIALSMEARERRGDRAASGATAGVQRNAQLLRSVEQLRTVQRRAQELAQSVQSVAEESARVVSEAHAERRERVLIELRKEARRVEATRKSDLQRGDFDAAERKQTLLAALSAVTAELEKARSEPRSLAQAAAALEAVDPPSAAAVAAMAAASPTATSPTTSAARSPYRDPDGRAGALFGATPMPSLGLAAATTTTTVVGPPMAAPIASSSPTRSPIERTASPLASPLAALPAPASLSAGGTTTTTPSVVQSLSIVETLRERGFLLGSTTAALDELFSTLSASNDLLRAADFIALCASHVARTGTAQQQPNAVIAQCEGAILGRIFDAVDTNRRGELPVPTVRDALLMVLDMHRAEGGAGGGVRKPRSVPSGGGAASRTRTSPQSKRTTSPMVRRIPKPSDKMMF